MRMLSALIMIIFLIKRYLKASEGCKYVLKKLVSHQKAHELLRRMTRLESLTRRLTSKMLLYVKKTSFKTCLARFKGIF